MKAEIGQMSGEIAAERWENEGGPVKTEMSAVVALYNTHNEAEEAVRQLPKSGFDMQKLSIVGKDYYSEKEVVGYYTTGDRMKAWGKT